MDTWTTDKGCNARYGTAKEYEETGEKSSSCSDDQIKTIIKRGAQMGKIMFEIQTRNLENSLCSDWSPEIGDGNGFDSSDKAWEMIEELKLLDDNWESADWRVVEIESEVSA